MWLLDKLHIKLGSTTTTTSNHQEYSFFAMIFFCQNPHTNLLLLILAIHQDKKNLQECGILAIFFIANILEGEYQNIKTGPKNSPSRIFIFST